jgi:hypothetical protein
MMVLIEPPAQYDHPYPGQVVEQRLSLLQIIQLCHGPASSCAWVSKGVCYIALPPNEKDGRLIALMRQHEMGHCNGWPGYHSGGRRVEYEADKPPTALKHGHVNLTF